MQNLSKRLKAVASLVKKGSSVADVGTDHGYIPVYLIENDIVSSAIAMDINEKPLASCQALVKSKGLENKIQTRLSNGLENLKRGECDTVIIAGMGAELIVDILSHCDFKNELHLILQPMTHPEIARKYLYDNGFEIFNDFIVKDSKHFYSAFDAKYTGTKTPKTQKDYYFGNISDFSHKNTFYIFLIILKINQNQALICLKLYQLWRQSYDQGQGYI